MSERPEAALTIRLLRLLEGGGTHSLQGMAQQLGISPSLASAVCDGLVQRGYLRALETGCETHCGGCVAAAACGAPGSPPQAASVLLLTDKGRRAAQAA